MTPISPVQMKRMRRAAALACRKAYAPYSRFKVGSAVLDGSGRLHLGCNVENASYGLCQCAERNALAAAVLAGAGRIRAVAVYTPTAEPTTPCGACRQAIAELAPRSLVLCFSREGKPLQLAAEQLLPAGFDARALRRGRR